MISKRGEGFKPWIVGMIVALIFLVLFMLFATNVGERLQEAARDLSQRMVGV